jgi:hypothetical protein
VAGLLSKLIRPAHGIAACALLLALPIDAKAAGIGFRNDLKIPIIVQGESLIDGMIRKGQPVLILPRGVGWDLRLPMASRRVVVYDATVPGRILHRDIIPFQGQDLRFLVRPGPAGTLLLVPVPGAVGMPGP